MTTPYFIAADLNGLPVLVVGAGRVATRKVRELIAAGARVTVIAPRASDELRDIAAAGRVEWLAREWRWTDIGRPAALLFAATDDAPLNARIHVQGRRVGKLVNTATAGTGRSFSTPAVAHGDGVSVAVSTHGANVLRALQWRDRIAKLLPPTAAVEAHGLPPVGSVATSSHIATSQIALAPATVTLVGAGPGDPDLLTVAAVRALERADVIVHDHLVSPDILDDHARPDAVRIDVGKDPFGRVTTQDEIHRILLREARDGRQVVRLKGGDPFVFGRGTEEIEQLAAAGVAFRLIPGVSSLTGVLGAAGVAVTKRGRNHGFAVFSAADPTPGADFSRWAQTPGPLVIFMGVRRAGEIARGLIDGGRASDEPVVVIARGGTPTQRVVETTLDELGTGILRDAAEWTPALIVVGAEREVAFAARALDGQTVAVSGRLDDARADALRAEGAIVARAVAEAPGHVFATEVVRENVSESRRIASMGLAV
ncbi:MAG: uroporphyrinogen-III C-methyltransferase [Planctomycetota bacterium]